MHPRLLVKLWRHSGHVELGRLLPDGLRLSLWEAPCGLAFFDPMIEGDEALYPGFYEHVRADRWLFNDADAGRAEFASAAALVGSGDLVLDVGCGPGAFGRRIPQARYVGLDPYAPEDHPGLTILRESIYDHAQAHPGVYDAVCAFQVLEHTKDPRGMAEAMVAALKPGGLFMAAVPSWPSPLVEIPNFAPNAVPHHLSWWTPAALQALCTELGLDVLHTEALPPQVQHKVLHWTWWFSPVKARGPYFRHAWSWHFSLIFGFVMARLLGPFVGLPPGAGSMDCFVAARKPV